jgi:PAS domain-containing protein
MRPYEECQMTDDFPPRLLTDTELVLCQSTALALLEYWPTAILGLGPLGDISYANPACAEMLGYPDGRALATHYLPELLTGHEAVTPIDCLATLRTAAAEAVVEWNHARDHVVRTMLSRPLQLGDSLHLVGITDITDWLWETNGAVDAARTGLIGRGRHAAI